MQSAVGDASPEAEGPGKGPAWDPAAGETRTCVYVLRRQVPAPSLVCTPTRVHRHVLDAHQQRPCAMHRIAFSLRQDTQTLRGCPGQTHRDVGLFTPRLLGASLATVDSDRVD